MFKIREVLCACLLTLGSAARAADIHGPGSWAEHAAISAALSQGLKSAGAPDWSLGLVCAGFLIREMTQRGGAFNDLDSNMDWAVPCAVAGGVAISPNGLMIWRNF